MADSSRMLLLTSCYALRRDDHIMWAYLIQRLRHVKRPEVCGSACTLAKRSLPLHAS